LDKSVSNHLLRHYLVYSQSLTIDLAFAKICSLLSFENPLLSAFSSLALIRLISIYWFLACLIKSLTSSLLLEYSWLSTCDFNHLSFGSVNEMLCLGMGVYLDWC
jgi:hypothetical protein